MSVLSLFQQVPLGFQISWIVLGALGLWAFFIARRPRQWRRLYQAWFSRADSFSVNRNKLIDERLRSACVILAMVFVVAFVVSFVTGLTYQERRPRNLTPEDQDRMLEQERIRRGAGGQVGGP